MHPSHPDRLHVPHRRRELPRAVLLGAALTCALAQAGLAGADDTEVFFGQVDSDTNVDPNVLFILDNSGSMRATDGGSRTRMHRLQEAMRTILSEATDVNVGLMRFNGRYSGGPVLYPVTPIDAEICTGDGCEGVTLESRLASGDDDHEEAIGGGWGGRTHLHAGVVLDLGGESGRGQAPGGGPALRGAGDPPGRDHRVGQARVHRAEIARRFGDLDDRRRGPGRRRRRQLRGPSPTRSPGARTTRASPR